MKNVYLICKFTVLVVGWKNKLIDQICLWIIYKTQCDYQNDCTIVRSAGDGRVVVGPGGEGLYFGWDRGGDSGGGCGSVSALTPSPVSQYFLLPFIIPIVSKQY